MLCHVYAGLVLLALFGVWSALAWACRRWNELLHGEVILSYLIAPVYGLGILGASLAVVMAVRGLWFCLWFFEQGLAHWFCGR